MSASTELRLYPERVDQGAAVRLPDPEVQATMTVTETAQALRIGKGQVYNALRRDELPHVRVGRRVLILTAPLRRMLDGQTDAA